MKPLSNRRAVFELLQSCEQALLEQGRLGDGAEAHEAFNQRPAILAVGELLRRGGLVRRQLNGVAARIPCIALAPTEYPSWFWPRQTQ